MAAAYLGLDVRLFLKNQTVIDGRVLAIDEGTQLITLQNAIIKVQGKERTISTHHVPGQEIADLKILKKEVQQQQPPPPKPQQPAQSSNVGPSTPPMHPQGQGGPIPMAGPTPMPPQSQPTPMGHPPGPGMGMGMGMGQGQFMPFQLNQMQNPGPQPPHPIPGQMPMPPTGMMGPPHNMPGMGPPFSGGIPLTQQQLFGMAMGGPPPPMPHHMPGTPLPPMPVPPMMNPMGGFQPHPMGFMGQPIPQPHLQPQPQGADTARPTQQNQSQPASGSNVNKESPVSPILFQDPAIISVSKKPPTPSKSTVPQTIPSVIATAALPQPTARKDPQPPEPPKKQQADTRKAQSVPTKQTSQASVQFHQPSVPAPLIPAVVSRSSSTSGSAINTVGPFLAPPHLSKNPESATEEEEEIDFAEFTAQSLNLTPTVQPGVAVKGRRDGGRGKRTGSPGTQPTVAVVSNDSASRRAGNTNRIDTGRQRTTHSSKITPAPPQVTITKSKAPRGKQTEKSSRRSHEGQSPTRRRRRDKNEWANEDAEEMGEDFDIQGSLKLFDKNTVFSEIRESDMTDPETLLVSHNRVKPAGQQAALAAINGNSSPSSSSVATPPQGYYHSYIPSQPKLGIREPVLDIAPSGDETGNDAEVESELESDAAAAFEAGDEFFETTPVANEPSSALAFPRKRPVFTSLNGLPVPSVTPAEMVEIERLAVEETGPNEEQMIENGGRGVAMMVLQVIGGGRRIKPNNHNSAPVVVVLAGNNKTGAYSLCAARHLANHEVNVMVCAVGNEAEQSNTVAYQRKIYLPTGGQIVKGIAELPLQTVQPVDLIIDALLGPHQTILDIPSESDRLFVCDLMKWANDNKANVLSLDVPSGISGLTGQPTSPSHYVSAKWTVAFGLPKTGLMSRDYTGELFLADIGIPKIVFQKFGRVGAGGSVVTAAASGMARIKYSPPFALSGDAKSDPRRIADVLIEQGYRVWIDVKQLIAGKDLHHQLAEALEQASIVVLCISDEYIASKTCNLEASYICDLSLPIVQVVVGNPENNAWKKSGIKFKIGSPLYIDFRPQQSIFDDRMKDLIRSLQEHGIFPSANGQGGLNTPETPSPQKPTEATSPLSRQEDPPEVSKPASEQTSTPKEAPAKSPSTDRAGSKEESLPMVEDPLAGLSLEERLLAVAAKGDVKQLKKIIQSGRVNVETRDPNGWTPLSSAASNGHLDAVTLLVKAGAQINTRSSTGWTPLALASLTGHLDVVQYLVVHNANIEAQTDHKWTPIYSASYAGHATIVSWLLDQGAKADSGNDHNWYPLSSAANAGHLEAVKVLVEKGKADLECRNDDGSTPLFLAAMNNHLPVVQYLLKAGANPKALTNSCLTPLHAAASMGWLEVVQELISAGAGLDEPSTHGWTPLHAGSFSGQLQVIKALFGGKIANVDAKTDEGCTAFFLAASKNFVDVMECLKSHGCSHEAANNKGWTPLMAAADGGCFDAVEWLIEHRVTVNAADQDGRTALHHAAQNNHLAIVELLLENSWSIAASDLPDNEGMTPLMLAALAGHSAMVKILLGKGASKENKNNLGKTPLELAQAAGKDDTAELLSTRALRRGTTRSSRKVHPNNSVAGSDGNFNTSQTKSVTMRNSIKEKSAVTMANAFHNEALVEEKEVVKEDVIAKEPAQRSKADLRYIERKPPKDDCCSIL
ncbi:enhancer of mRNA decapping [Phlyctochytrium bullatum]|nr:enhancer of mRNA decapping [Phlyctochytrium bullatum]